MVSTRETLVLVLILYFCDIVMSNTLSYSCDGDSGVIEDLLEVDDASQGSNFGSHQSDYAWTVEQISALENIESRISKVSSQFSVPVFSPLYPVNSNIKKIRRRQDPLHCDRLYGNGTTTSGVHQVDINGRSVQVYCQFEGNGLNWLVFQRRFDGSVDFYQNWTSYENGFGNMTGEFWLGLMLLSEITSITHHTLRVDLQDFDGNSVYADYRLFIVRGPGTNYSLRVEQYSGNAGDGMSYHSGFSFSTFDRDLDFNYKNTSCAVDSRGAWWYNSCYHSNLNGNYYPAPTVSNITGITWISWKDNFYSLRTTRMKIRVA